MSTSGQCRHCLLAELTGMDDVIAMVGRTKKLLSDEERASDSDYEKRLSVCRQCDNLSDATCSKCGCYVEIRALSRDAKCPYLRW